jgi:hypothetical protein
MKMERLMGGSPPSPQPISPTHFSSTLLPASLEFKALPLNAASTTQLSKFLLISWRKPIHLACWKAGNTWCPLHSKYIPVVK